MKRRLAQTRAPSAIRRAWLYSLLLSLPALIFCGIFSFSTSSALPAALLVARCLLIYLAFVASALVEGLVRPLQTLSNVVSSLREGDYSFRARGAGVARCARRTGNRDQRARRPAAEAARALAGSNGVAGAHSRSHARAALRLRSRKPAAAGEQRGPQAARPSLCALLRPLRARDWASKNCSRAPDQSNSLIRRRPDALAAAQGRLPPGWRAAHAACCWPT